MGQSIQLTATATVADGTRLDVTSQVAWQSSEVTVAVVSSVGLLTVTGSGETDVTATLQNIRGTAHVVVTKAAPLPPVRYDVSGVVHESPPTEGVALSGATVGIHFVGCPTCPHDNESTTTDTDGRFTLPGIETAGFTLVVAKPGYETTFFNVAQLPRDGRPDIAMLPPPGDISFDLTGNDVCVEHPRDPFFSGPSLCENKPCEAKARTVAVFDAHRSGTMNWSFSPFQYPFSRYTFGLVYSISSSGKAVEPPYSFGPSGGWVATPGTRYYAVIGGQIEMCNFPYVLFGFRHPR
jgi:hypothetical protein